MEGIKPVNGRGFLDDFEAIAKAHGEYVDIGWFDSQGSHPTAKDSNGNALSYPDLAKFHATGGGGKVIVRDVLAVARDTLGATQVKKVEKALNKWLDNPKQDPDKVLMPFIGAGIAEHIKGMFGGPLLHPTSENPDPLIDSGEFMKHTAYKVKDGVAKE